MTAEKLKYDVAISFLSQDISLAQALYDKLCPGFEVFFFPDVQEVLAGTDGLESMRAPFRHESRLNVVLYRPNWGKTDWTAVEEIAIKESCLENSFRNIFFYVIESTHILPKWLPDTHIYFSASHYSLDEAVGAIKARVQDRGGEFKSLTPIRKAELTRAEGEYQRARKCMSSEEGRTQIFSRVKELFDEICKHCDDVNAGGHAHIEYQVHLQDSEVDQICTLDGPRVGMIVIWHQRFSNTLDQAFLGVREFSENMIIPVGYIRYEQPDMVGETKYDPEMSRAREYGWKSRDGKDRFLSSKELASQCVIQFLDLVSRDAAGKVPRKNGY